jgi:hypothetical protein
MFLFFINLIYFLSNNTQIFYFIKKIHLFSFILLSLIFFNIYSFTEYRNKKTNNENRFEKTKILQILSDKNIETNNLSLLTFDSKIMIWAIFNDFKNINILDGQFSPRSHDLTDESLVETFRFLNLKVSDFQKFIENKKRGYRYLNEDARSIYWLKYQANSSVSFEDSSDFETEVLRHIQKSSPYYSHQFAIPKFEQKRLIKMFQSHNGQTFPNPDLIILNKKHYILKNAKLDIEKYCTIFDQKSFRVYLKKNNC